MCNTRSGIWLDKDKGIVCFLDDIDHGFVTYYFGEKNQQYPAELLGILNEFSKIAGRKFEKSPLAVKSDQVDSLSNDFIFLATSISKQQGDRDLASAFIEHLLSRKFEAKFKATSISEPIYAIKQEIGKLLNFENDAFFQRIKKAIIEAPHPISWGFNSLVAALIKRFA